MTTEFVTDLFQHLFAEEVSNDPPAVSRFLTHLFYFRPLAVQKCTWAIRGISTLEL